MSDINTYPGLEKRDSDDVEITLTHGRIDDSEHGSRTQAEVVQVMEKMLTLMNKKQRGYSDSWRDQGYMGNVARVLSKASRIRNLLWRDNSMADGVEAVEDTILDLALLAIFTYINRRDGNKWGR